MLGERESLRGAVVSEASKMQQAGFGETGGRTSCLKITKLWEPPWMICAFEVCQKRVLFSCPGWLGEAGDWRVAGRGSRGRPTYHSPITISYLRIYLNPPPLK